MNPLSYSDVIQMNDVRNKIENELKKHSGSQTYSFKPTPKILYKFCNFADYVIRNIEKDIISFSPIESLNDTFDSSIHIVHDKQKIMQAVESFPSSSEGIGIDRETWIQDWISSEERIAKVRFSFASHIGVYVSCFSEINDSTLMWSHYADNNQGICVGYNFNLLESGTVFSNSLFPIMYSDSPINLKKYFNWDAYKYNYEAETGITIATLSKANCWRYEKEWRFIYAPPINPHEKYLTPCYRIKPCSICLGHHFLKKFIDIDDFSFKQNIDLTNRLFDMCEKNQISIYWMTTNIGSYNLVAKKMSLQKLKKFFSYLSKEKVIADRFYHVMQDEFLKCIEDDVRIAHEA